MEASNLLSVESAASTNTFLTGLAGEKKLPEGFTVITGNQSAGRGQGKNQWESDPGCNLTFSTLFYPSFIKAGDQFWISKAMALGISDFALKFTGEITIKWPNDIYAGSSKISGTLIENVLEGHTIKQTVVGIGFNVNQTLFRSDAPNPVSLKQLTHTHYALDEMLEKLRHCLFVRYEQLRENDIPGIEETYHHRLYQRGIYALYRDSGGIFKGAIRKVLENGTLEIEREDGTSSFYGFKEVSFVK